MTPNANPADSRPRPAAFRRRPRGERSRSRASHSHSAARCAGTRRPAIPLTRTPSSASAQSDDRIRRTAITPPRHVARSLAVVERDRAWQASRTIALGESNRARRLLGRPIGTTAIRAFRAQNERRSTTGRHPSARSQGSRRLAELEDPCLSLHGTVSRPALRALTAGTRGRRDSEAGRAGRPCEAIISRAPGGVG